MRKSEDALGKRPFWRPSFSWQIVARWLLITLYLLISLQHLQDYAWVYDEGVLLQTAVLSQKGYPLYAETVFNKPPLLIWWVQGAFALGGVSLASARVAVLVLTAVLLWLLGALAKAWWGQGADLVTMVGYLLIPETVVRANVVMNDLPAMTLMAVALLAATYYYKRPHWLLAVAAGGCYGLGFGLHPLLVYIGWPLAILLGWPALRQRNWRVLFRVGVLAAAATALVTLAWLLWIDWSGFWQWVVAFNQAPLDGTLQAKADRNLQNILFEHGRHWYLLVPAAISFLGLWRWAAAEQRFFLWLTAVWYVTTLLILLSLQPMWFHYLLFAYIPLLLLLSGGIWLSWQAKTAVFPLWRWSLWGAAALFLLVGLLLPREWVGWTPEQIETADYLRTNLPADTFVISDDPFLLFAADMLIPPTLADGSTKRIATDLLRTVDIIQARWQYGVTDFALTNGRFQQLLPFLGWVDAYGEPAATFGEVTVLAFPPVPSMAQPIAATLNDAVQLEGVTFHVSLVDEGKQISGTLFWQTAVPLPADYKIFVHLLDKSGNLVAQYDGSPQQGWLPTSRWRPNQPVLTTFRLLVEPETAVGDYELVAGMYTWPDIQRLPVRLASGETPLNLSVPLGTVTLP